jgi:uncharacterized protein YukE
MEQTLLPPRRWEIRKPSGDPHAARRLATSYEQLADALDAEVRRATGILVELTSVWRGAGQRAADGPEDQLINDARAIGHALRESATDLRAYAHRLQQAHDDHHWSLGRLVAAGAMVVVGTAAVVVTVGAAAPAEAALAAVAVEGAEAAAVTAAGAGGTVAAGLMSWEGALAAVRPLLPFVVPHLVSAGGAAGLDVASRLVEGKPFDLTSTLVSADMGFMGCGLNGMTAARLAEAPTLLRRVADIGAFSSTVAAGDYAGSGRVDPLDLAAAAATGTVAPEIRAGVDHVRLMWRLRVPQLPVGFASGKQWRTFVVTMYAGLDQAGNRRTVALFQGSSVTGVSHTTGVAFDVGRTSDYDVALVDPALLRRAQQLRVPLRWSGTRTAELWPRSVRMLGLAELRKELSALAGRPVNFMVFADLDTARSRAFVEVPRP